MQDFRKLNVWEKSLELAEKVYTITDNFPKSELYGITSQIRRSSISIAANIAEGCSRKTDKDFINFLRISLGSLNEVITYIYLSKRLKYLTVKD